MGQAMQEEFIKTDQGSYTPLNEFGPARVGEFYATNYDFPTFQGKVLVTGIRRWYRGEHEVELLTVDGVKEMSWRHFAHVYNSGPAFKRLDDLVELSDNL
ncbi:MAG: hypothetical protein ABIC91_05430 [Nanoarchaeota archaeon]